MTVRRVARSLGAIKKGRIMGDQVIKERIVVVTFDDGTNGEDPTTEVFGPFADEAEADEWISNVEVFLSGRGPTFHITRLDPPLQPEALAEFVND
jgi:hypothetical protein